MWKELPKPLMSKFGFQGCLASLELNGEMIDPLKVKYSLMNLLFFNKLRDFVDALAIAVLSITGFLVVFLETRGILNSRNFAKLKDFC